MMRCEDALALWVQALQGQPVDPARLAAAVAHIHTCQNLCAQSLGASPDDEVRAGVARRAEPDLYAAQGLSAEEEGDAHARRWARLKRLLAAGRAPQEEVDQARALALAAWQSAANYYADGLRLGPSAALSAGLERIKGKRLVPPGLPPEAAG